MGGVTVKVRLSESRRQSKLKLALLFAVVPDGYGLSYSIDDDYIRWAITSLQFEVAHRRAQAIPSRGCYRATDNAGPCHYRYQGGRKGEALGTRSDENRPST